MKNLVKNHGKMSAKKLWQQCVEDDKNETSWIKQEFKNILRKEILLIISQVSSLREDRYCDATQEFSSQMNDFRKKIIVTCDAY